MTHARPGEPTECDCSRAQCDPVAEASVESFPASDPSAWTEGRWPDWVRAAAGCCCDHPPAKT